MSSQPWLFLVPLFLLGILIKRVYSPVAKVPGPWYSKFTSLWLMYQEYTANRRVYIHALHEKYGPVVRLGPNEVSFSSGEAIKEIYTSGGSGYDKTEFYSLFKQFGYRTMFSTLFKTDHSQKKRHIAGQYANTNIMRPEVLGGIQERADVFVRKCKETEGSSTDIYVSLHCYALDCASHHLFHPHGTHSLEKESDLQLMQELSYHNSLQRYLTQYYFPSVWKFFMRFSKPKRSPQSNDYVLATSQISPLFPKDEEASPSPYSLLNKLHTSKFFQNDTEIAAECMDHMAAGIDTTGDALCFLIYQLSLPSCQSIQRSLQEEALAASANGDSELPYLDAVIKEGLRLFPPIPMSQPRYAPAKGSVIDGFYLPGHTIVSAQAWTVHRLEGEDGVFENAGEFRPERWLFTSESEQEKEKEMNRLFFAFGLGGRGCTGRHLAMAEMKILLREIYSRFDTRIDVQGMQGKSMELSDQIISSRPRDQTCRVVFLKIKHLE